MANKTKTLLVIRLSAMGDVAMTVPVIRALCMQYPFLKITILTRPFFKPFFRDLPNVTVCHANLKTEHKGFLGLFKLSRVLKKQGVDAVADLHGVLRTHVLKLFFLGKPFVQINKGRKEKKALVEGKHFKALKNTHTRYADVFARLGYPVDLTKPIFPDKVVLGNGILKYIGDIKTLKIVGIAPFAAHEGKMYSLNLMKEVIDVLSKKHTILLFGGGEKEITILKSLEQDNVISLAGQLSLNQELDVMSNLDLMLSMDSGNAHMAAMLGVKVVTIWGVTHPYAGFSPFNQPLDYALTANRAQFPKIPTSIYGNKFLEGYQHAAASIPPSAIVNKIETILNRNKKSIV